MSDVAEETKLTTPKLPPVDEYARKTPVDKLWSFVRAKNVNRVRELLTRHQTDPKLIEAENGKGLTPLAYAYKNNIHDLYDLMEKEGANLDALLKVSWKPLHVAASKNDSDEVCKLYKEGHDVEARDKNRHTPLSIASQKGQLEVVKVLLSKGASIHVKTNQGWTPLHNAAFYGHADVVEELLKAGAKAEARTSKGSTPLHFAASNGYTDVVEKLLEAGADKDAKTRTQATPLHFAASNGHAKVVEVLSSESASIDATGSTPLPSAAANNHLDVVRVLLSAASASINATTNHGWTPLHNAVFYGHADVVEELLKCEAGKAIIEEQTKDGRTPLYLAAQNGHLKVMEKLLRAGADDKVLRNLYWTPLHVAALWGNEEEVEVTIQFSMANTDAATTNGLTALNIAAINCHQGVVRILSKYAVKMLKELEERKIRFTRKGAFKALPYYFHAMDDISLISKPARWKRLWPNGVYLDTSTFKLAKLENEEGKESDSPPRWIKTLDDVWSIDANDRLDSSAYDKDVFLLQTLPTDEGILNTRELPSKTILRLLENVLHLCGTPRRLLRLLAQSVVLPLPSGFLDGDMNTKPESLYEGLQRVHRLHPDGKYPPDVKRLSVVHLLGNLNEICAGKTYADRVGTTFQGSESYSISPRQLLGLSNVARLMSPDFTNPSRSCWLCCPESISALSEASKKEFWDAHETKVPLSRFSLEFQKGERLFVGMVSPDTTVAPLTRIRLESGTNEPLLAAEFCSDATFTPLSTLGLDFGTGEPLLAAVLAEGALNAAAGLVEERPSDPAVIRRIRDTTTDEGLRFSRETGIAMKVQKDKECGTNYFALQLDRDIEDSHGLLVGIHSLRAGLVPNTFDELNFMWNFHGCVTPFYISLIETISNAATIKSSELVTNTKDLRKLVCDTDRVKDFRLLSLRKKFIGDTTCLKKCLPAYLKIVGKRNFLRSCLEVKKESSAPYNVYFGGIQCATISEDWKIDLRRSNSLPGGRELFSPVGVYPSILSMIAALLSIPTWTLTFFTDRANFFAIAFILLGLSTAPFRTGWNALTILSGYYTVFIPFAVLESFLSLVALAAFVRDGTLTIRVFGAICVGSGVLSFMAMLRAGTRRRSYICPGESFSTGGCVEALNGYYGYGYVPLGRKMASQVQFTLVERLGERDTPIGHYDGGRQLSEQEILSSLCEAEGILMGAARTGTSWQLLHRQSE
eukprot:scaffold179_cov247-Pinguiococcus_pyrenoidosus.AAC.6